MTEFHPTVARLVKMAMMALEMPYSDRSDLCVVAGRVLKLSSPDPELTKLAHDFADTCLLVGYFDDNDNDRLNLSKAATALLRKLQGK